MKLLLLLPMALAARIIQSNDDGWAELSTRALNTHLISSGNLVGLSAPADDKSGSGSRDEKPSPRTSPCEYNSCVADGRPTGMNASRPDLHWVNSYPATSMRYGIQTVAPALWGNDPIDFAVSGPNVGTNLFLALPFSGTIGAACVAAHDFGIPTIAYSGGDGARHAWDTQPVPRPAEVYAQLATNLTNFVLSTAKPYLPTDVILNVNFPKVTDTECSDPSQFSWVLSRVNPGIFSKKDVQWCGSDRLPTELSVYNSGKCRIPVSIVDARDKTTVNDVGVQQQVLDKLKPILSCL